MAEARRVMISLFRVWWNAEAHYALETALGFKKLGYQVLVYGWAGSPWIEKAQQAGLESYAPLPAIRSPLTAWHALRAFQKFTKAPAKPSPALATSHPLPWVISFTSTENLLLASLKTKGNKFFWLKVKASAQKIKKNGFNLWIYPKIDQLVAVSKNTQRDLEHFQRQRPVALIYFGSPAFSAGPALSPAEIEHERAKLFDRPLPIFCLLGRAQDIKGHLDLLFAYTPFRNRANLLFLIKDLAEYPRRIEQIRNYIALHGLEKEVAVLGHSDQLARILQAVDLGVIPSKGSEEICRVLVEFFSLQKTVLAYPTGALPEIIQDGKNGFLTEAPTPALLAEKLEQFLNLWQQQAPLTALERQAARDYQERYSTDSFVKAWQTLLC